MEKKDVRRPYEMDYLQAFSLAYSLLTGYNQRIVAETDAGGLERSLTLYWLGVRTLLIKYFLPKNQTGSLCITHVSRVKIRKDTPSPLGSKTRFQLGLSSLYRLLAKFHIREYTTIHHLRFFMLFKHPTRLKSRRLLKSNFTLIKLAALSVSRCLKC